MKWHLESISICEEYIKRHAEHPRENKDEAIVLKRWDEIVDAKKKKLPKAIISVHLE